MNYVIVGNGAAGISAAENLRKLDNTGIITMITAERYQAYSKCLLSDYLAGDYSGKHDGENRLYFKDDDFYSRNRIQVLFNHQVNDIDFHQKVVKTLNLAHPETQDMEISYDRLLIATGSKPVMPLIKGYRRANPYYLNTLDNAKRIMKAAAGCREAAIMGAGFVGLEVAFNLRKRGLKVTLIDKATRILPAQLDETAAKIITRALESEGIKVCLGAGVTEVVPNRGILRRNHIKGVILENGNFINADMLVIAVGSVPNLDFVTPGKLEAGRGIIVNRQMMTSVPDVYAAGDVAQFIDAVTGASMLTPIWPNAVIEGEYAAYNMAGIRRELDQLIGMQNAAEFREIPLVSMGLVDAAGPKVETLIDLRPAKGIYRKIVLRDNRIIGMIFLGDISQSGVIGALIRNRTPVGHLKVNLLAPTFGYSMVANGEGR
jgi:NAD(P)H-nitrite reductase large subunit